jgi:sec-independent protein translocase protein TatC
MTNKKLVRTTDPIVAKYLPYLQEIQQKLFHVFIVFFTAAVIGFIYYQKILGFIMGIFKLEGINIVLTSPYEFVNLAVNTGILLGLIFALPLLGVDIISFVKNALKYREYKLLRALYPASLILFVVGFLSGVWTMQLIIAIYAKVSLDFAVENLWNISSFFNQIISTGIMMAVIFQLPIVLIALLQLKIVKMQALQRSRKYVYSAILILVALLPPNDIFSLTILTFPPLLLFELALLFNKLLN